MDLLTGNLQHQWQVWTKNHWTNCLNLSGIPFPRPILFFYGEYCDTEVFKIMYSCIWFENCLFYRLLLCCYSTLLIGWAIQRLWPSWTWLMKTSLDYSIPCHAQNTRSLWRSQTLKLFLQMTALSSTPNLLINWEGSRSVFTFNHNSYLLLF